jgi:thioredoxin reductase
VSEPDIRRERCEVAIVGGGPAGLAAAAHLREAGAEPVVVLDREPQPGGIPRHARHQGFGIRDLHRVMSGPAYALRLAERASAAGAEIRAESQVTGWSAGALEVTSPGGRYVLEARATVLATGCRERPRSARLIAGSRPQGVMTTSTLQQLVYLRGETPGRRAVIVGAEHVSFSALLTLAHGGARAVAMVTSQPEHQTFTAFRIGARLRYRCPLLTRTAVSEIRGRRRVEGVELMRVDTSGATREVECDLIVLTAGWVPDHELAVLGGVELDPLTRGPEVDGALRTTRPGVFAAGNVLNAAETADIASLSGRHVAQSVANYLDGRRWPESRVPIRCEPPLGWIAPSAVSGPSADPPRGRFLLRASERIARPRIELVQDDRRLWRGRLRRLGQGRSTALTSDWTSGVDVSGGPVTARLVR